MAIPSFLTAAMKTTVQMNGVYVRFDRCIDSLQRFCRPVLFHNDDKLYEASYAGSSFLLRYKGHNVLLCTQHQLGQGAHRRTPDELMIILEEAQGIKVGVSPDGAAQVRIHELEAKNLEDIVLVEYMSARGARDITPHFYQLNINQIVDLRAVNPEQILAIFAIGYPSRFSSFEAEFDSDYQTKGLDVRLGWSKLYLEMTEPSAWDIPLRLPLQVRSDTGTNIGDPDGFSGAPVFVVYQDDQHQSHLKFVGMMTHGSKDGRFMIYEAERIRHFLDRLTVDTEADEL